MAVRSDRIHRASQCMLSAIETRWVFFTAILALEIE